MVLKALSIIVMLLMFGCPGSDGDDEDTKNKVTNPKVVRTSSGLEVRDAKVNYDISTKDTSVSASVYEADKPKTGVDMVYTLVCGDPRYGALEVKFKAVSDTKGLASVSKVYPLVDANNVHRCSLHATLDGETLELVAGNPIVRKRGTIYDLTYEKARMTTGYSPLPLSFLIVFDANGVPIQNYSYFIKDVKHTGSHEGEDISDGTKFRFAVIGSIASISFAYAYQISGLTAIYDKETETIVETFPPEANDLRGCTPSSCWDYDYDDADNGGSSSFRAYVKDEVPKGCSRWIKKTGNEYRILQFLC